MPVRLGLSLLQVITVCAFQRSSRETLTEPRPRRNVIYGIQEHENAWATAYSDAISRRIDGQYHDYRDHHVHLLAALPERRVLQLSTSYSVPGAHRVSGRAQEE